jgi:hypothetical protein
MSSLARGALCPASALRASSATVTAGAAQVFVVEFVQQPLTRAGVASLCYSGSWWGVLLIAPAALHFYLGYRLQRSVES